MTDTWREVEVRTREILDLGEIEGLLTWDQRVMMPPGGGEARAGHLKSLASILHGRVTDPRLRELVDAIAATDGIGPVQHHALRRLRRHIELEARRPQELVEALNLATARAYTAWERAREHDDFSVFATELQRVIDLKREEAEALGYAGEPYDALLDEFEEGMTVAEVEPTLGGLADAVRPLLAAIVDSGRDPGELPAGPYPQAAAHAYSWGLALRLGYEADRDRLDPTIHPFEVSVGHGDVRVTTRFFDDDFTKSYLATAHETGHALYELGLQRSGQEGFAAKSPSHGLHESQSRFWENHVARQRPFWDSEWPHLVEAFPVLAGEDPGRLHAIASRVRPSLVRVGADEVTYPLHIISRFEIELGIMRGQLEAEDLAGAFREAIKRNLGVEPVTDVEGVLQDVHWSIGAFGYFPTYAIGSVYAASLFAAAQRELGGEAAVTAMLRQGETAHLLGWLREKVHRHGSSLTARQVVAAATGLPAEGPIDFADFVEHLTRRYSEVYSLS